MSRLARRIRISLPAQTLELRDARGTLLARYAVSTGAKGAGEQRGSYQTPRGRHIVRARIGAGQPINTVFVGRRPTGEIWTPALGEAFPGRDWILTRILWLSGREVGFNRLGMVDTMRRYIYLHGTPDDQVLGTPGSHGCVRMGNADIVELFDGVTAGTAVDIVEYRMDAGDWSRLGNAAYAIREQVFIREQGVPEELELDEYDPVSNHVVARGPAGEAIGTARLLADGRVGRFAVLPAWRGKGVGQALMDALLDAARGDPALGFRVGETTLELHSQLQAAGFYRGFGFAETGQPYMEAGLPHVTMTRTL